MCIASSCYLDSIGHNKQIHGDGLPVTQSSTGQTNQSRGKGCLALTPTITTDLS
jgi:hypothetical protein